MSFRSENHQGQAGPTIAYSYDAAGRLIASQHGDRAHRYPVDAAGNRLEGQASAQPDNRLTQLDGTRYRHDGAGNLIERETSHGERLSLGYDGANRLVRLTRTSAQGATEEACYCYDALGRRISKTVHHANGTTATTHYGWDGDRLVHEAKERHQTTVVYEPGSFVPMLRIDETTNDQATTRQIGAYHTDALGTPMQLVTPKGETLWQAQPDDWAAIKHERGTTAQPIRFQGQWHDEESGLYYNRHRYYDPQQGRYISQDPIGLKGGTNLYGYVTNPTGMVDPLGLVAAALPFVVSSGQWLAGVLGIGGGAIAVSTIPGSTSQTSREQEAVQLTAAHQAAAGNRSILGYGGNCTPDEYEELRRQQVGSCDRTKNIQMCGEYEVDYRKAELFDSCAQARINLARRCFSGGDAGHNHEINQNLRKSMSCTRNYERADGGVILFQ